MEFANKNLQGDEIAKTTYLQHLFCGQNGEINIVLFMSKCKIKIFSLDFMPLLGNGAAICPLQKSRKSKHCTPWRPWDHLSPLLL